MISKKKDSKRLLTLTKRERWLLLVLGFILYIFGFGYYLLLPQMKERIEVQSQYEQLQSKYIQFQTTMNPNNPIHKKLSILDNKMRDATAQYYPELLQEKIILVLEDYFKAAGLNPGMISFDNAGTANAGEDILDKAIKEHEKGKQPKTTVANSPVGTKLNTIKAMYEGRTLDSAKASQTAVLTDEVAAEVSQLKVAVSVTSTDYFALIKFLKAIEGDRHRIIVDNVTISNSGNETVSFTLNLRFFSVPRLWDDDKEYLKWNMAGEYGSDDPFKPYSGYTSGVTTTGSVKSASSANGDFFIMLNPVYSDLTTVVMSKKGDKSAGTYIYADNSGIEKIELEVIEKNKKFYYHYKTQGQSYPADYSKTVEFIPSGNQLGLQIVSNPRKEQDDVSGAAITLINKTSLKLNVSVLNDDVKKPRVQIVKKVGTVVGP